MDNYRLSDLIDVTILQKMADSHYRAAGMPIGIIDAIDGSILVGAGWQDICVLFHRANPVSLQRCMESDNHIKGRLVEGEACRYKCKNGLWDIGMPIMVVGRHLATLFLGQFFYEGEIPDRDFFIRSAREFGFDVDSYLSALDRVPVFSREKVDYILEYDKALVSFISDLAGHALIKIEADQRLRDIESREISERKRAQEEIRQQAEFLQLLIDAMPYPVFYKDCQSRYLGCNRAFEQFYGMSRSQIAGKTAHEVAPKELAEEYRRADDELFKHPGTQMYEGCIQSVDGIRHDVIFHRATYGGPDGAIVGIVGAVVDITERKGAEKEKQRLQDQLAQAQKLESIGRLAGGVAHDFNNMLSIIIGYAETALERLQPSDPVSGNMREIISAGNRSTNVVRQLLAFARQQTIVPKVLDLNDAVEDVLKMLRRLISENIDLLWKPGAGIGMIKMDPSQIDQLLANLVVNARDAIRDVGRVIIETAIETIDATYCETHPDIAPGDYAMLSVNDDGCGMDRETLANIFEPFFTTKGVGKGTGLGLATVYGIAKQNKGFVNAYSEPGRGSTFKVYIPRCRSASGGTGESAVPEKNHVGNETILLVEDEAVILNLVKTQLASMGYTVLAAHTPDEAVRLAGEFGGEIHLLMTDVIMPGMNGRELAKSLLSLYPNLKRLFMSGYTADVIAHHGILDEGFHFIQKPFSKKELAFRLRTILDP